MKPSFLNIVLLMTTSFIFITSFAIAQSAPTSSNSLTSDEQALYNQTFISVYNKQFNTSFASIDQINQDNATRVQTMLTELRACKAGNYPYLMIIDTMPVFASMLIKGVVSNKCALMMTYSFGGFGKSISECSFDPGALPVFVDYYSKLLNDANLTMPDVLKDDCTTREEKAL